MRTNQNYERQTGFDLTFILFFSPRSFFFCLLFRFCCPLNKYSQARSWGFRRGVRFYLKVLKSRGSETLFSAFSMRHFIKKSISINCKTTCIFSAYQLIYDKCYTEHVSSRFPEIAFPACRLSRLHLSNPERLLRKSHLKGASFEPLEPRLLRG